MLAAPQQTTLTINANFLNQTLIDLSFADEHMLSLILILSDLKCSHIRFYASLFWLLV